MFTLNLARIRTASERVERRFEAEACGAPGDTFGVMAPVSLAADVFKDRDRFRLIGTVETLLELPCSRCLEPSPWPVRSAFDLLYEPRPAQPPQGEHEIEDGDFSATYYENDEVDLRQLVREQLYLAVPMKPLCREACQGLCPVCGANLNLKTCGCRREWDDPRLAALRALKRESRGHDR